MKRTILAVLFGLLALPATAAEWQCGGPSVGQIPATYRAADGQSLPACFDQDSKTVRIRFPADAEHPASGSSGQYASGVSAKVLSKTGVTGNGAKIAYPATDQAEVTAMTVDIAPGAETGWHKHPIPVYAYVIAGSLEVEIEDGTKLTFQPGDAIIEVVNAFHNGRNKGTTPVRLAVFYTGVAGQPNVIKR